MQNLIGRMIYKREGAADTCSEKKDLVTYIIFFS